MDVPYDGRAKNDSSCNQGRRDKGRKRTQINMAGYKGQKEEFLNAFNQSLNKEGGGCDSLQNSSSQIYKEVNISQQNEISMLQEGIQDQEAGIFLQEGQKKESISNERIGDLKASYNANNIDQMSIQIHNRTMSRSKDTSLSITASKLHRKWNPYQGQDILNDMYFNYTKIYEGRKMQLNGETTNLPLVMKLKEVAIKLANSIQTRREKQLTEQSYLLINDMSYFNDRKDKQQSQIESTLISKTLKLFQICFNCFGTFKKCTKFFYEISSFIPIFSPSNPYKLVWDLLQLTVIIACLYAVPIVFVFKMKFRDFLPAIFSWILPFLLILDIPINMNTGFYEKGAMIKSRKLIIISYIKKNYVSDILSIIPLIIHFLLYEWNYQKQIKTTMSDEDYKFSEFFLLLIFFKIQNLSQIIRRIEERYHFTPRTNNIISLIKLLFTVLFVAHLFSQIWLFTAFFESTKTSYKSWIQFYNLEDSNWISQYIRAYYFATVTMITVGYGDTVPTNDPEMILCIFTMLIACGVFAYSVNSIGMILMDFSSREKEIKDNLFAINNYMDQKNVNQELQYKIRQYLEYYWREMKDSNIEKEEKIICQLSELLRDELLLEANKLILKESPIFSSNFTDYIIQRTVKLIHEYRCAPEETICFEDMQDDCSIYFIQKGEVDIYIDSLQATDNAQTLIQKNCQINNRILKSLKKGDHFGGVSFFTGAQRGYTICSKEFTTLLMIKRYFYKFIY